MMMMKKDRRKVGDEERRQVRPDYTRRYDPEGPKKLHCEKKNGESSF
jgi:hypothetical protein